jgi:hypothetical protein
MLDESIVVFPKDFQEHQYEIHAKLVAIMADRLHLHLETLKASDASTFHASKC